MFLLKIITFISLLSIFSSGNALISQDECPPIFIRTLDGSCNDFFKPDKGKIGGSFIRLTDSGFINVNTAPNPRFVSNEFLKDPNDPDFPIPNATPLKIPSSRGLNALLNTWGELFGFESGGRETSLDPTGSALIPLPGNDPLAPFLPGFPGIAVSPTISNGTEISNETGEEVLLISSPSSPWLQGEQIYPTDEEVLNNMRTLEGGRLKIRNGNLVPTFVDTGNPIRVNAICAISQNPGNPDIGSPCIPNKRGIWFPYFVLERT